MRFFIALICLIFLAVSSASAGPLRNFIQNRRAAHSGCPCECAPAPQATYNAAPVVYNAVPCNPWQAPTGSCQLSAFSFSQTATSGCTDGSCKIPKAMPKIK